MAFVACAAAAILAAPAPARGAGTAAAPPPPPTLAVGDVSRLAAEGDLDAAETLARGLLAEAEAAHGKDGLPVASVLDALAVVLAARGETAWAEARLAAERSLAVRERVLGAEHVDVALSLDAAAEAAHAQEGPEASRPLLERALRLREAALGPDHADVATSLHALAGVIGETPDRAAARPLYERALRLREAALGPDHLDVASTAGNLAWLLHEMGDAAGARPLRERVLAIRERALGPEHPRVADALASLASSLLAMGQPAAAKPSLERALAIREKRFGGDSLEVATSLEALGRALAASGDPRGARSILERSLAIREARLGPQHADVAPTLDALGTLALGVGALEAAQRYLERALAIRESLPRRDEIDVAVSALHLGRALRARGEYERARGLMERGLAGAEAALGADHPTVATAVASLAGVMEDLGRIREAVALHERALAMQERAAGPESAAVSVAAANLGLALFRAGDYAASRPHQERALAIAERVRGPDDPGVADILGNLSGLLRAQGDLGAARTLLERALAIQEKARGPDDLAVGRSLYNLAALLVRAGDRAAARPLMERALSISERALGPDHPVVATCVAGLGALLHEAGEHEAARPFLERALALRSRALGPEHPDVAQTARNLGLCLAELGDEAGARQHLERALAGFRGSLGDSHPDVGMTCASVARLLARAGESGRALDLALEAEAVARGHVRVTAKALSQREALSYAAARRGSLSGLDVALSILAGGADRATSARVLDEIVRSRQITLDVACDRRAMARSSPGLEEPSRRCTQAAGHLAALTVRGPGGASVERHRQVLEQARRDLEDAERELARASPPASDRHARWALGLADVAEALPAGSALVSYVRYTRVAAPAPLAGSKATEPAYLAFVLRSGDREPTVVPLGPADALDSAASSWRDAVRMRTSPADVSAAGSRLRELAWDPLASAVSAAWRVLVVPDGALLFVPLPALPRKAGGYVVEGDALIGFLAAERDVAAPRRPGASPSAGLLAMGGADFGARADGPVRVVGASVGAATAVVRGSLPECPSFDTLRLVALPGTAGEARQAARTWRLAAGRDLRRAPATLFTGALATEAAFRREAGRHSVIHLATHGFFLGGDCGAAPTASRGLAPGTAAPAGQVVPDPVASPLLRSGLALAGFNRRDEARSGDDDGVLTAEEVASMDLSGVEWAVLSACDTALGYVQAGEGVLGLERAFRIAGAATVVMSAWKVPDEETRRFMDDFYLARLARGPDAAACVRDASLARLRDLRERGESDAPLAWGAFMASGAPP